MEFWIRLLRSGARASRQNSAHCALVGPPRASTTLFLAASAASVAARRTARSSKGRRRRASQRLDGRDRRLGLHAVPRRPPPPPAAARASSTRASYSARASACSSSKACSWASNASVPSTIDTSNCASIGILSVRSNAFFSLKGPPRQVSDGLRRRRCGRGKVRRRVEVLLSHTEPRRRKSPSVRKRERIRVPRRPWRRPSPRSGLHTRLWSSFGLESSEHTLRINSTAAVCCAAVAVGSAATQTGAASTWT